MLLCELKMILTVFYKSYVALLSYSFINEESQNWKAKNDLLEARLL